VTSFLRRTLQRSRARLSDAVGRLLPGRKVDEADLDALEEALIASDVGPETAEELVNAVREATGPETEPRGVLTSLMTEILEGVQPRGSAIARERPEVWMLVGVNGSGKTTTAAKLAHRLRESGRSVILGAADTFRAAAVEQLQTWGERLDVSVVAHRAGGDPAAVVFDTCEAARARDLDVALIDTAGRLHTQGNLMAEIDKVRRVAGKVVPGAPHEVLLVLDGTTGQNGLRQAEEFLQHAGVTGLVLAKLDGTARGGIALNIARQLRLPIRYVGTGEGIEDLEAFDARAYVEALVGERT
jgi:fused signal recognition particle receptor